jgi:hypothetical protein
LRAKKIPLPDGSIFFLEQGAKCNDCDWQIPIGQVPFYSILLPDAQQSRSYGRILAVKARVAIAEGDFEGAVKTFQTNYALGCNVAKGKTLVNGLVGIAICNLMAPQITEYMQQPEAPNLYWALTTLPQPLIGMSDAVEVESQGLELSFPELRDIEKTRRTPEEWREIFHHVAEELQKLYESPANKSARKPTRDELDKLCDATLPTVKAALIAAGWKAKDLEAMPAHQIALINQVRVYHEVFDSAAKWYTLPYLESMKGVNEAMKAAKRSAAEGGEVMPCSRETLKALAATRGAIARNERRIAALRIFEALRIYAAAHGGKLPQQLADITEVPIPIDPVTEKAFDYNVEGDRATLKSPMVWEQGLNYEISMAAKSKSP